MTKYRFYIDTYVVRNCKCYKSECDNVVYIHTEIRKQLSNKNIIHDKTNHQKQLNNPTFR